MPSRFSTGAPYVPRAPYLSERLLGTDPDAPWDYYDNCPLDPDYVAPVSLTACTRAKPAL